jgi:hypothetical protein
MRLWPAWGLRELIALWVYVGGSPEAMGVKFGATICSMVCALGRSACRSSRVICCAKMPMPEPASRPQEPFFDGAAA